MSYVIAFPITSHFGWCRGVEVGCPSRRHDLYDDVVKFGNLSAIVALTIKEMHVVAAQTEFSALAAYENMMAF